MIALRSQVFLSVQRALLGNVMPVMRAVLVRIGENSVHVRILVDGPVSEQLREIGSEVETEIMADFADSFVVSLDVERMDAPAPLPKQNCEWVYARWEP